LVVRTFLTPLSGGNYDPEISKKNNIYVEIISKTALNIYEA
jgi:hypothetical protein